jgi:GT2 family glycosyltransferase
VNFCFGKFTPAQLSHLVVAMKLSVIIPCYNAGETIAAQLEALASQEWSEPWEVIVSDNNSTDESVAIAERYRQRLPNLRIVQAAEKQGGAYAINVGSRFATGESIAFCDADDVVAPGWLAAIGEALRIHDFVAPRFDMQVLNPSWVQSRMWTAQGDGLLRTRFHPHLYHAGSCGLGVKRHLFEAVGGFDESLPVLWDSDFCFKVQLTGVSLYFAPQAVVYIRQRSTLKGAFNQARQWASYNVLMYRRYRSPERTYPRPWKLYLILWEQLLLKMLHIRKKEDWARCVWALGWQIGLLQGSFIFREPPLPM